MSKLNELKEHLRPGKLYRRTDLTQWSKSVDRHLKALVREGFLKKLHGGLYHRPKQSVFGELPADEHELVRTFLKDDRFLITSPNVYNSLGLGTTQLYNKRVVYNHKRHGKFVLGGRTFDFRMKHHFPRNTVTEEFLLVDLVNNLDDIAEDQEALLQNVRRKTPTMNTSRLAKAIRDFGHASTKKFFDEILLNVA